MMKKLSLPLVSGGRFRYSRSPETTYLRELNALQNESKALFQIMNLEDSCWPVRNNRFRLTINTMIWVFAYHGFLQSTRYYSSVATTNSDP